MMSPLKDYFEIKEIKIDQKFDAIADHYSNCMNKDSISQDTKNLPKRHKFKKRHQ